MQAYTSMQRLSPEMVWLQASDLSSLQARCPAPQTAAVRHAAALKKAWRSVHLG